MVLYQQTSQLGDLLRRLDGTISFPSTHEFTSGIVLMPKSEQIIVSKRSAVSWSAVVSL